MVPYGCGLPSDEQAPSVLQDKCQVYVWGSNSSHQLTEDVQEKLLVPKLALSLTNVQQVSYVCFIPSESVRIFIQ